MVQISYRVFSLTSLSLRCWHKPLPEGHLLTSLMLLLATFNKALSSFHTDGTWWSDACRCNHADVCPPLLQIRVSRGRWSLLRTWWCWETRRLRSTASSPPFQLPRWSGTTKTSCWQTSLGMLRTKSSPPLRSFLSHHTSLTPPLHSPSVLTIIQVPALDIPLNPMRWNSCVRLPALCVLLLHSLKIDCTFRYIIPGTERGKISLQSTRHYVSLQPKGLCRSAVFMCWEEKSPQVTISLPACAL